ncbi:MGH1-like glycoside hydrolase domain-containing protein [Streptomyces sp. NPDC053542]|uniref:MGH1-like glycoside hydrolase domain-containing protein n=1 Tax=Streptomyces sp. NPDC053542 TaxID=3365710 RepID=UPI0037D6EF0B
MSRHPQSRTRHSSLLRGRPVVKAVLTASIATVLAATMPSAPAVSSSAVTGTAAAGAARCAVPEEPGRFKDGTGSATMTVTDVDADCLRTYKLVSSVAGERVFKEAPGKPTLRSGSVLLDGLYAMAHDDAELNKTDRLTDGSYNDGKPIDCPGGCYQTGKLWTYVWTRDVAYSADLGLTTADPERMRNTLAFKLSERRDGSGDTQIIQDTGTGGSYPSSTDRVVWALGASEIINWLPDGERQAFADKAYEAIRNTIEHDRKVVFDQGDGLYLGEHSFLDWREQSYADWTKDDVATIATSRSLSTNVTHWAAIDAASRLAADAGDKTAAAKYRGWADDLMQAVREKFWLPEKGQFSQMLSTEKDNSPVNRYDALGTSLAVLTGVATPEQAKQAVANYPQTAYGPSVLWPQQQGVPSYHNNAVWPFVTAYMMRAAARTGNDAVATQQARSLVRGGALFATNKENINILDGSTKTVLNSDRQLWSVAGMMSMVQQSIFGIDAREDGLHIDPFLPAQLRGTYFPGSERSVLNGLDYRGHKLNVALDIPAGKAGEGAYQVESLTLDGKEVPAGTPITEKMLGDGESTVVVKLARPAAGSGQKAPKPADLSSKEALYGPTTPDVKNVTAKDGRTRLSLDIGDENPAKVTMDVLRDGKVIAENVAVGAGEQTWTDRTARPEEVSHCYSVRLTYTSSGNTSQHAEPECYWGPGDDRVHKVTGEDFEATGGKKTTGDNGVYYADWGTGPSDKLAARITPKATGEYLLQADAAVGGPINTGVSSGMKMLRVYDDATGELVTEHVIAMPNTGSWTTVRGSTFAKAELTEGKTYRIELAQDPLAVNMSYFQHNALYKDTRNGPSNYSDVYAIKALLKRTTTAGPKQ